jgi:hypothetical protein
MQAILIAHLSQHVDTIQHLGLWSETNSLSLIPNFCTAVVGIRIDTVIVAVDLTLETFFHCEWK